MALTDLANRRREERLLAAQPAVAAPVVQPQTKLNPRAAEAAHASQAATHQSAVAANQAAGTGTFVGNYNPATGQYQTQPIPTGTIDVATKGGTIGYDSADWKPNQEGTGVVPVGYIDPESLVPMDEKSSTGRETPAQFQQRKLAVIQQNNELLKRQQIEQQIAAQRAASNAASTAASQNAGATAVNPLSGKTYTGGAAQRLQQRLGEEPIERQDYIERRRAEGASDAQIRSEIASLPPEQTGGVSSVPTVEEDPVAEETPQQTGQNQTVPQAAPMPDPNVGLLRNIAATLEDPIMKAILNAEADRAEMTGIGDPMSQSQFNAGEGAAIGKPFDAIDAILTRAFTTAENTYNAQKDFLKGQYDRNERLMAEREENINNQLTYANQKAVRDQKEATQKLLDSQTIMLALGGGFGSSDGNRELAEARLKGEEAIINLNKEFGFKKTDVSLAFTEEYNRAFENYQSAWNTATENFESKVSDISLQGISNQQAKSNALRTAYKEYVTEIKGARKEQASIISNATQRVYEYIGKEKTAERQREQDALDQIEYLSKTYPPEQIQDTIRELAKNVKSFDATLLAGMTPIDVQKKLDSARRGGGGGGLIPLPTVKPTLSFNEFVERKIAEEELDLGMSLTEDAKEELREESEAAWKAEYTSLMGPSFDDMPSSGDSQVDLAAKDYLDGRYGFGVTSMGRAASARGVNQRDVLDQVRVLESGGYRAEGETLTNDQKKAYNTFTGEQEKDKFYVAATEAISNGGVVLSNIDARTGVGDIAAINALQSGLIDPNATVRSEDIKLIQSAIALRQKFSTKFWMDRLNEGILLPEDSRAQMKEVVNNIVEMRKRNYNDMSAPKFEKRAQLLGLPSSVVYQFGASGDYGAVEGDEGLDEWLTSNGY